MHAHQGGHLLERPSLLDQVKGVGDLDRADRLERGASEQAARVREEVPAVAERVERGRETDMSPAWVSTRSARSVVAMAAR